MEGDSREAFNISQKPFGFIYEIRNKINDKIYIGKTTKEYPSERKYEHLYLLRRGKHHNQHLQNAFNKYGEKHFEFKILVYVYNSNRLNTLEQEFICKNHTNNPNYGYNLTNGEDGGNLSEYSRLKAGHSLRTKHYFLNRVKHYQNFKVGRFNLNNKHSQNYKSTRHVKIKTKLKLYPIRRPRQNRLRIPQNEFNRFRQDIELKKTVYCIYRKLEGWPHSLRTNFLEYRGNLFD